MTDAFFMQGEILGDCVLQRPLRVREERELWFCFNRREKRASVLKLIRNTASRAGFLPAVAHFLKECTCPQVIRVLDYFPADPFTAVEFEYVSGGTLSSLLKKHTRLELKRAVFLFREMLTALEAVHKAGFIHRDIKPGNVWLDDKGGIRLGDFGIARVPGHTEAGPAVFGTASGMSPEQTVDTTQVDFRSDLFSLSSLMFEALTGEKRFAADSFTETLKLIRESKADEMRARLLPFATGDLTGLLCRMGENSPDARPADVKSVLEELDRMNLPCADSL